MHARRARRLQSDGAIRAQDREAAMPNTKNFDELRAQLLARLGAAERLAEARAETLTEIAAYERRDMRPAR